MTTHATRRRSPGSSLPPLYAGWMEELLPGPIPPEHDTTCGDCPMLAPTGAEDGSGLFFLPDTKCCTYVPTIPNFLVGRILDEEQAGRVPARETVETRMARRIGVTPLGLAPPPVFSVLYREG